MKNILVIGLVFLGAIFNSGCDEKEDPAGLRGVGIVPAITDVNPAIFDSKNLENSYVEFNVELTEGDVAEKAVIVASYKGDGARVEVAEITSFPAVVRILSSDVAEKLEIPLSSIKNGDVFTFELLFTSNGKVTTSNSVLNVSVACAFDPAQAVGTYHVISEDWETEGQLTLTADPENPYRIFVEGLATIDGLDEDQGPLVMDIDPLSFKVVAPKAVLASDYFGYTNGAFAGSGTFGSCDGKFTMNFAISVNEGAFGTYLYVMTRIDN
jgi:hypothetical protein